MTWANTRLEDFVRFRNGRAIKAGTDGAYPVYGSNGIIGACDDWMYSDAIILGRVGAYCGSVERCFGRFWASDNTIVVEADHSIADTQFVYYLLLEARLNQHAGGAAQPLLTHSRLKPLAFHLPPLPTQRRIAAILSAYDDLIENNTRRIAILDEMARRLYEEWFVHFRFPGHEEAEFDGELPKGWRRTPIGDLCSYLNRGLTPQYAEDGTSLVINQKCIRNQKLDLLPSRRQNKVIPQDKLVRFGDVLINSTGVGTLGRVAQVYSALERVTVDTHVTIARPGSEVAMDYFGMSMLALQPHFEDQGVGSTGQTELSRSRIGETTILLPPVELQEMFGRYVAPMRNMCGSLANKNANLRAQRDMLLPKLISGLIDVSGAEELLEAAE